MDLTVIKVLPYKRLYAVATRNEHIGADCPSCRAGQKRPTPTPLISVVLVLVPSRKKAVSSQHQVHVLPTKVIRMSRYPPRTVWNHEATCEAV